LNDVVAGYLLSGAEVLTSRLGTSQRSFESGRGVLILQPPGRVEHQGRVAGGLGVDRLDQRAGPGLTTVSQGESHVLRAQAVETPAVNRRRRHAAGVEV
jgi:hypothetical protein